MHASPRDSVNLDSAGINRLCHFDPIPHVMRATVTPDRAGCHAHRSIQPHFRQTQLPAAHEERNDIMLTDS
jgi:hypothetical protein